jgi:hypothetical protein
MEVIKHKNSSLKIGSARMMPESLFLFNMMGAASGYVSFTIYMMIFA